MQQLVPIGRRVNDALGFEREEEMVEIEVVRETVLKMRDEDSSE